MGVAPHVRARGIAAAARAAAAVLLGGVVVAGGAVSAQAHNGLVSTSPAADATEVVAPRQVVLQFDQPAIAIGTQVVVTGPDGNEVSEGEPQLVNATVSQALGGDLPAGDYTVAWRVTSADGHPISGSFGFWTGTAASPTDAPATSAAPTDPAQTDPAQTDPAQTDPAETDPAQADPASETPAPEALPGAADETVTDETTVVSSSGPLLLGVGALVVGLLVAGFVSSRRRSANGPPGQS